MQNPYAVILEKQLAVDYDCTSEDVQSGAQVFRIMKRIPGARPVGNEKTLLKIAVYKEKLLVMADAKMMNWCMESFCGQEGTWFSEPKNLIMIDRKLRECGQCLADAHHYYIPVPGKTSIKRCYDVKWYEKEEIEEFRGDGRFWEALLFDERNPDALAVCAMDGNVILGMAGATHDTDRIWQIGVNVTAAGAGKGIGTYVTTLLKEEILSRGIVPIYATVESHIKSQKVAFQSGFEPAFYEIFSE